MKRHHNDAHEETRYCPFEPETESMLLQVTRARHEKTRFFLNQGYTATPVACGWAGAITEVSGTFGQEQ